MKNLNIFIIGASYDLINKIKDSYNNLNYSITCIDSYERYFNINKNIDLLFICAEYSINELIKAIKFNFSSDIPIILFSKSTVFIKNKDYLECDITDFINISFTKEELLFKTKIWMKNSLSVLNCKEEINFFRQYKNTIDMFNIVSKTNENGKIIYVNDKFCEISGYSKDELIGKNHNIIRHPDMHSSVFENIWETIKYNKKAWIGKIKNKKKNGNPYYVDTIINPILDEYNNIVEYIAIRHEVTENEEAKELLKKQYSIRSNEYEEILSLSNTYENAINESNIIIRIGFDRTITYCNDLFYEISGYTEDELLGKPYSYIINPKINNEDIEKVWKHIESGNIWKGKLQNLSKDGKVFYFATTIVPLKDKNGNIFEYISIRKDITELINLHNEIEQTQRELIYKLGEIAETRSQETGYHLKRVAEYSKLLALKYGLSKEEAEIIKFASPMHDIGKIGIPDSILNKPGKLTPDEFEIMKNHVSIGYDMLKNSTREILKASAIIANTHHEKWDGTGYPNKLKENNIHIYGRITAIADVFDALGSDRPYKEAWTLDKILNLFKDQKGKHFDPKLIEIFFNNLDKFIFIRDKFT